MLWLHVWQPWFAVIKLLSQVKDICSLNDNVLCKSHHVIAYCTVTQSLMNSNFESLIKRPCMNVLTIDLTCWYCTAARCGTWTCWNYRWHGIVMQESRWRLAICERLTTPYNLQQEYFLTTVPGTGCLDDSKGWHGLIVSCMSFTELRKSHHGGVLSLEAVR